MRAEDDHAVACTGADGLVQGRARLVLTDIQHQVGVAGRDNPRVVGRRIVDCDDLDLMIASLFPDCAEDGFQVDCLVPEPDDDVQPGHRHPDVVGA